MSAKRTKLVEKAATAVSRGKYKRALECYQELERLEPADGAWSRRSGEMFRHLERQPEAVEAFARSVEAYARSGFLVKAIAVCKLILRISPSDVGAKNRLEHLTNERFAKPERREFAPIKARSAQRRPTIPPGQAIEEVRLRDTVPGAKVLEDDDGISLIPIDVSDFDEAAASISSEMSAALRDTKLFEGLAAADLNALLEAVILKEVAAGATVFSQGDRGGELYVIDEGEVRVLAESPNGSVELGRLKEGDFFGEIALVAETPRTATIEAVTDTELLVLSRTAISELVESEPSVLTLLLRFIRDRLFARLTSSHELLASFSPEERSKLAARFELLEVEDGASIITEGQPSKALFVVLAGKLSVRRNGRTLADLGPGDVSGEMSLLTQEPAIASVTADTKALVVRLPGDKFRQLIMTHPQVLAYVAELADTRQRLLEQFDAGEDSFENLHLDLV